MGVPAILNARNFGLYAQSQTKLDDGRWVPARPLRQHLFGIRLRAAWLVFSGRADAVRWPGQEEPWIAGWRRPAVLTKEAED